MKDIEIGSRYPEAIGRPQRLLNNVHLSDDRGKEKEIQRSLNSNEFKFKFTITKKKSNSKTK